MKTHKQSPDALERVTVTVPRGLLEAVENYWHRERLGSRSAAIQQLLEAALAAEKQAKRGKG